MPYVISSRGLHTKGQFSPKVFYLRVQNLSMAWHLCCLTARKKGGKSATPAASWQYECYVFW